MYYNQRFYAMPDVADEVDEHPIIFNAWSINRILAGEKTQTRRIVKPQPHNPASPNTYPIWGHGVRQQDNRYSVHAAVEGPSGNRMDKWIQCPYGQSGDVLWVREGFQFPAFEDDMSPRDLVDYWEAEAGAPPPVKYSTGETRRSWNEHDWGRKRLPIHMPRELCRLRLRVEDIGVERVQEISDEDVEAEGVEGRPDPDGAPWKKYKTADGPETNFAHIAFRTLWNDIHGDGAWERNDWVWKLSFSPITE